MPSYRPVTEQEANLLAVLADMKATSGIIGVAYDYIGIAYPDTVTEVYTYKTGGSTGTTVATVTLTYQDATKNNIISIART